MMPSGPRPEPRPRTTWTDAQAYRRGVRCDLGEGRLLAHYISSADAAPAAPHAHKHRTPPPALRLEPRRAALDGRAAAPLRVAAECPPTHPHSSIAGAQGYWRFGAIPRAVPVVWNQYTFYSIGYTTTLVVASTFYSTRHWYNVSRIVYCDRSSTRRTG